MIPVNRFTVMVFACVSTIGAIGSFMENKFANALILAAAAVMFFVWLNKLYKEKAKPNVGGPS